MDYGSILSRALNLIWENKFLIVLGLLVAIGSGEGSVSGNVPSNVDLQDPFRDFERDRNGDQNGEFNFDGEFDFEMPQFDGEFDIPPIATGVAILLGAFAVVVGLALWVLATSARGGLIAGVDTIAGGGTSTLSQAWGAGWNRIWTLLGIGILPAIPGLISALATLALAAVGFGLYQVTGEGGPFLFSGLGGILIAVMCITIPIGLLLSLLGAFANRACMMEELGVFASYRRGFEILIDNLGSVIVLFLLQVVIQVILGLSLLLPSVCCILWPFLIVVRGAIVSYFSALWTLAYREWIGGEGQVVLEGQGAPAA